MLILAIAIGIASVTTSNKHLAQTFIAVLLIEWIFEFIGVYASKDRNILIYRLVPCTLRPGLLTLMFMFIKNLNAEDEEYAKEINKSEEGGGQRHLVENSGVNNPRSGETNPVGLETEETRETNGAENSAAMNGSNSGNGPVNVHTANRHISVIPITTNF